MQGRLQPAARSHLALVAEAMRVEPPAARGQKPHRFLNLSLVRVAFLNYGHGDAVGAEDNFRPVGRREPPQGFVDLFDHRVEIRRITIERLDAVNRHFILEQPPPFVQTRSRGGRRILRVQGQEHHFLALGCPQLLDRLARKGMPVAHRNKAVRIDSLASQLGLQRTRLLFGVPPDRRASANSGVVMLHLARARSRNQLGQRFAPDAGEREVDNIGVAEQVIQKRFDRFQRVGSAELKENYPHTPWCARHFPQNPQNAWQCTPNRARESMADCKFDARSRARPAGIEKIGSLDASWYPCQSCRTSPLTSAPSNHASSANRCNECGWRAPSSCERRSPRWRAWRDTTWKNCAASASALPSAWAAISGWSCT